MSASLAYLIGVVCIGWVSWRLYQVMDRDDPATALADRLVQGGLALIVGTPLGGMAAMVPVLVGCLVLGPLQ